MSAIFSHIARKKKVIRVPKIQIVLKVGSYNKEFNQGHRVDVNQNGMSFATNMINICVYQGP